MINLKIETKNLEIILRPNLEIQRVKTKTYTSFNVELSLPYYWTIAPFSPLTVDCQELNPSLMLWKLLDCPFNAVMKTVGLSLHCWLDFCPSSLLR